MITDRVGRKGLPLYTGCIAYFPDALVAVAEVSRIGNDQHNPGKPLHWDRNKSQDELDALTRHLIEAGTMDTDGVRHSAKVAWRALANLQKEIENERASDEHTTERSEDNGQCSDAGDGTRVKECSCSSSPAGSNCRGTGVGTLRIRGGAA